MPPRRRPPGPAAQSNLVALSPATHVESFLQYLAAECGMSANTIAAYRNDLRQFTEWSSSRRIQSVQAVDLPLLGDYLQALHERNLSASTIARRLVALKMFFRYLVLEGVLTQSAVDLMSSPKLWEYLPTVLSPETVDKLLAAPTRADAYPLRDRALLAVLYATGCRASEVSNLTIKSVRLADSIAHCRGKGNKERIVNLNPVAVSALEAYIAGERTVMVRGRDQDALFVTRAGKALTRIMIWKLVKKYATRAGCADKVSPHTLRHSFATHMLAGGAEIRALQEMLGHASIRTTQVYTHVEHSRLKSIHAKCHPRG
ncbi:Tyrosine recombinase XerD [Caulifigura coniformis]|uniref:Tyrosine recombinase XerC n=1 Tax=Caulifigura coniformis TaxID=2527983 RepID=A0A517SAJ6_9PLAN|nr:site-specific tyrosine recombinase XerD [Caulifigura coniformis]QDT53150.1 Tyrosine recombinase XerD [Caulifigura coniformis]